MRRNPEQVAFEARLLCGIAAFIVFASAIVVGLIALAVMMPDDAHAAYEREPIAQHRTVPPWCVWFPARRLDLPLFAPQKAAQSVSSDRQEGSTVREVYPSWRPPQGD